MSEVISFRLNPGNPREAIALQILKRRTAEGCSIRQIITEALIHLVGKTHEQKWEFDEIDLKTTLIEISKLLQQLKEENFHMVESTLDLNDHDDLNNLFISSIKSSVKPGLKAL